MPQITHMPLDEAIKARRISRGWKPAVERHLNGLGSIPLHDCVTLLDEREYEQKEQLWMNEERMS